LPTIPIIRTFHGLGVRRRLRRDCFSHTLC
jgi:hypothetical protein